MYVKSVTRFIKTELTVPLCAYGVPNTSLSASTAPTV